MQHIDLEALDATIDPACITKVCSLMLEKLGIKDKRWEWLNDDINRDNHKLYNSLYAWIKKKIQQRDRTISDEEEDENELSNEDSMRNIQPHDQNKQSVKNRKNP